MTVEVARTESRAEGSPVPRKGTVERKVRDKNQRANNRHPACGRPAGKTIIEVCREAGMGKEGNKIGPGKAPPDRLHILGRCTAGFPSIAESSDVKRHRNHDVNRYGLPLKETWGEFPFLYRFLCCGTKRLVCGCDDSD